MEWIIGAAAIIAAFNLGRMTKAFPPEEVMIERLVKNRSERKLLQMTKKVLEEEIEKVSEKLLHRV